MGRLEICQSYRRTIRLVGETESVLTAMEKRTEITKRIALNCFYLAVITEVLIVIIDKSALINPIEGRLFQLTFLLCFVKVCLTGYSLREYLVLVLFLGLGSVSYFATGRNEILRIVMLIAACKDVDVKKCLKLIFCLTLAGCIVIMLLSLLGIGGGAVVIQDYGHGSVESRYTFGMGHPNALQCMVLALSMLGMYLYYDRMKWYHYLSVLALNLVFFRFTQSKTAILIIMYAMVGFAVATFIKNRPLRVLFSIGNILASIFSVVISVLAAKDAMYMWDYYTKGIFTLKAYYYSQLDKILTGRIASLIETVNHEGTIQTWSLFSRPENNYFFDMGWVRLFYWYGVIPAGIMVAVLWIFLLYCLVKNRVAEIVLISAISLYTVMEAHFVSEYIARNYVLFLLGMYWMQGETGKISYSVLQYIEDFFKRNRRDTD